MCACGQCSGGGKRTNAYIANAMPTAAQNLAFRPTSCGAHPIPAHWCSPPWPLSPSANTFNANMRAYICAQAKRKQKLADLHPDRAGRAPSGRRRRSECCEWSAEKNCKTIKLVLVGLASRRFSSRSRTDCAPVGAPAIFRNYN